MGCASVEPHERRLPDGECLNGVWSDEGATLDPPPPPSAARADVHLGIVRATFLEAGWEIAAEKVQAGFAIESLGLDVVTEGERAPDGAIIVPEAKRRGIIRECEAQLRAAEAGERFPIALAERTVGRLTNISQIVPEAGVFMAPLYSLIHAELKVATQQAKRALPANARERPSVLARWARERGRIAFSSERRNGRHAQRVSSYTESLSWWTHALQRGVSVPLACETRFPQLGEPGVIAVFTDAAREDGTGAGGFCAVVISGKPLFLHSSMDRNHPVFAHFGHPSKYLKIPI